MENASIGRQLAILIRAQLTAWVVTALLLLLMALLLFKLELTGAVYFLVLFLLSWNLGAERDGFLSLILTGALCLGGGMLGGMIS